jgi:hypothetical protein
MPFGCCNTPFVSIGVPRMFVPSCHTK